MPDDLTPEQIEKINEYASSFREEFESSQDVAPKPRWSADDVEGQLDTMVPDALSAISYTLKHGVNEGLKTKLAQWVIDKKIAVEKESKDPMWRFLADLPVGTGVTTGDEDTTDAPDRP